MIPPQAPVAAWVVAAAAVLAAGGPAITWLVRSGAVQSVREDAPSRHAAKGGTPTMGGVLIVLVILGTVLLALPSARGSGGADRGPGLDLLAGLGVVAVYAVVGGLDDALKIRRGRNLGLRAREKLALQIPAALLLGAFVLRDPRLGGALALPGGASWDLGWGYPIFCMLLVVGMANAVNLTDGLDGLAAGTVAICAAALGVLAARAGAGPAAILAAATGGAALGFVWHNAHPARVFMGDVGSQALGAALAVAGILAKRELVLLLLGGVFVAEAGSVVLQVVYFKLTGGRRLFRMSPIHHHYELAGWTETQTVVRFWICGALLAAAGVGLAR